MTYITKALGAALLAAGIFGCSSDSSFSVPVADLNKAYWSEKIVTPGVQLSLVPPYDTVTLESESLNPFNLPVEYDSDTLDPGFMVREWFSTDSSKVYITRNGFITAKKVTTGTGTYVFVRRTIGLVTKTDSALVRVTDIANPVIPATLKLQMPDSGKLSLGFYPIEAIVCAGGPDSVVISGLPIAFETSNPSLAYMGVSYTGSASAKFNTTLTVGISYNNYDSVTVRASTYAYGVRLRDTFRLAIGWPLPSFLYQSPAVIQQVLNGGVATAYAMTISTLRVGPGAIVYWENGSGLRPAGYLGNLKPAEDISIAFDDPSDVLEAPGGASGAGNISLIPGDTTFSAALRRRHRRFVKAGEYSYTIQPLGLRGKVIVGEL